LYVFWPFALPKKEERMEASRQAMVVVLFDHTHKLLLEFRVWHNKTNDAAVLLMM
jgi:hypothetical protein